MEKTATQLVMVGSRRADACRAVADDPLYLWRR